MATFARFFNHHGLLTVRDQPQWYVVQGGSHTYVKAFMEGFQGELRPDTPIRGLRRSADAVQVDRIDVRAPDGIEHCVAGGEKVNVIDQVG